MDVLKLATAGSVDDGKSTLIGRLLYDTHSLTDDKLEAIERNSRKRGYDYLDFSLATDGLVAEREQGITIDVAHIYFSTPTRNFIIADTPGHVEYTRNMVTGASNAQVSVILIDARKGVIEQTYRHFFINNLLRVKHIIVAVNKMDLVDYQADVFRQIQNDFEQLNAKSEFEEQEITYIPISALKGDNVVTASANMLWYSGPSVLEYLENVAPESLRQPFRFPVQTVIRPKKDAYHDYRAYAGKVYGEEVCIGERITVLPSGAETRIKEIQFFENTYEKAMPGSAVSIRLDDEVQVSRGDWLVKSAAVPTACKSLEVSLCWMDDSPLKVGDKYLIQMGTQRTAVKVAVIHHRIATDYSGLDDTPSTLKINEVAKVSLKLAKPIYADAYAESRISGSFILIHPLTNSTAGVAFIS